ncbi:MAG: radical SAM family heme chaperone HemW [Bacteroidales bacterium]|nr:radical SAM family heme chaperone HemW [Bacteroidales bacterium]
MAGIYIHIPFCSQYCTYCNFYSVKQLGLRERFVAALRQEAFAKRDFFKETGSSVTTLYIGGGTPSVLSLKQLKAVVDAVVENFGLELPTKTALPAANIIEEFTIEVNPNDVTPEFAAGLVALGVNRVSMGVQSFKDEHLRWMNRRHSAEEGERAVEILRAAGINNISIDLISGFEMLSDRDWEYNIRKAISLKPQHISAYQMSIEPGSALGAMAKRGEYSGLSDERCEAQYLTLQQLLAEGGYDQYEISNFALRSTEGGNGSGGGSYRSKHNSSYWEGVTYLGLGPAAHSYTGEIASVTNMVGEDAHIAKREWNNPSVKRYCEFYCNAESGAGKATASENGVGGYEMLTATDIFNETIMLGLRKVCGFSLDSLAISNVALLQQITPDINRLVKRGLLIKEGNNIRIPAHKLFISDSIIRELFL